MLAGVSSPPDATPMKAAPAGYARPVIVAITVMLLLLGCAVEPDSAPPDPTSSSTGSEPPAVEPQAPPEWPAVAWANSSGIKQLYSQTISDQDLRIHVLYPQLKGHTAFNELLEQWGHMQVDQFKADFGDRAGAGLGTPTLTVSWSLTGASDSLVGIMLHTATFAGANNTVQQEIWWYDTRTQEFLDPTALLNAGLMPQINEAVDEELRRQGIKHDKHRVDEVIQQDEVAVGFTDEGGLYIGFDEYTITAGWYGAPSVALADAQERGWLSEDGVRARLATIDATPGRIPEEPAPPPSASVDCSVERCVALTFDDGPAAKTTPQLLDVLDREQVPATFFVLGSQVQALPELAARIVGEGHQIAIHTWSHLDLSKLSTEQIQAEIADTASVIHTVTGVHPTALRPPYGATSAAVQEVAAQLDLIEVLWNVDTLDWKHRDPQQTTASAVQARSGSIILMHDIHQNTVDAVPGVIDALQEQGYTFVTVDDLLDDAEPGQVYRQR